jgi:hypothetical protein
MFSINSLLAIVLIQLWMLFNFSTFHIARWREKSRDQTAQSGGAKKKSGPGFGGKGKKVKSGSASNDEV